MEVCFSELKEKEIVNVFDGKKLGRIIDILFDTATGQVKGIVVPGDKKLFRKNEDIFVPLDKLKRIGDDVILVGLQTRPFYSPEFAGAQNSYYGDNRNVNFNMPKESNAANFYNNSPRKSNRASSDYGSYVRFRPLENKKYK